ncbi:MAG: zinc-ribbon domain-containing protein [Clostridia bacterium]|nr:zinc-ribbon domain-containing protein [Clostridia bacterium]
MFCPNCGKVVDEKAIVCPYCGVATGKNNVSESSNTLAIVGFILSFFLTVVGLICSILGYKKSNEMGGKGKGLALAGIIISSVSLVLSVIILFSSFATIAAIIGDL